tara:strand:- start:106 stop:465 length:360 start_codon:yes stop_codon:yes gene_type:complete
MADKIYNKNAREAHLMAEAYTNIYNDEDAEYETEADAYRDMSDKYKAEDSHYPEDMDTIKVGNIYKGESYHELVVGVKGDEVFTKKITFEDGNRYDGNQILDELKPAGKLNIDFLNEVL